MAKVCKRCNGSGQVTIQEEVKVIVKNKIVKQKVPKTITCPDCGGR